MILILANGMSYGVAFLFIAFSFVAGAIVGAWTHEHEKDEKKAGR